DRSATRRTADVLTANHFPRKLRQCGEGVVGEGELPMLLGGLRDDAARAGDVDGDKDEPEPEGPSDTRHAHSSGNGSAGRSSTEIATLSGFRTLEPRRCRKPRQAGDVLFRANGERNDRRAQVQP